MNHLYVSDLDGTLLRNDGTLSGNSRAALQQLLSEGVAFSVASARSVVSIRQILNGLQLSLPVIEFNGAFLSDLQSGHHEIVNSIERDVVQELYFLINRFSRSPFISTFNGKSDCLYYGKTATRVSAITFRIGSRMKTTAFSAQTTWRTRWLSRLFASQ